MYDALTLRVAARYQRSFEFPSEKARKEYLQQHPGAEPSKHTVKEQDGGSGETKKEPSEKAKSWLARAAGEVKSFFTDPKARQAGLGKAASKLKAAPAAAGRAAIEEVKKTVGEAKEAFAGVKTVMGGGTMSDSQKVALKKVAFKAATSIAATALVAAFPATIAHSIVGQSVAKQVANTVLRKLLGAATGLKLSADIDAQEMLGTALAMAVADALSKLSDEDIHAILESTADEADPV